MRSLNQKRFLLIAFLMSIIIIAHFFGLLKPVENGLRYLLVPISRMAIKWNNYIGNKYQYIFKSEQIEQQLSQCSKNNQNTGVLEAKNLLLQQENKELRAQLNYSRKYDLKAITASLVGRSTDLAQRAVIIDRGQTEGIQSGQPVIAGEGVLVGIITDVQKEISTVRLLNDSASKVAAMVLNKDKSMGVVEGGYGLSVRMNFIPRNEIIMIGDKIVTSGLEPGMPRGLLIGEVASAENEAYQPFQQAVLTTEVDLSKLFIVSVLISQTN